MNRRQRGLIITTRFPQDATFAGGVYRRLDLEVEALVSVTDNLTVLVLIREETACSEAQRADYEAYLRRRWSAPISLRIACVRRPSSAQGRVRGLIGGVFSFQRSALTFPTFNDAAREAVRAALAERPDIVLAHRLDAMSVLLRLPAQPPNVRVVFDLDDIEHVSMWRRLLHNPEWPAERLQLLHLPALMIGEGRAMRRATATMVCSPQDKRHLDSYLRSGAVHVVPNASFVPDAPLPPTPEKTVMFIGTFGYSPNVLAADRLVTSVWPLVKARVPDARLIIAGKDSDRLTSHAAAARDPSITLTGFVDDLSALYAGTRVMCCPIAVAGGTRVKIIEAAAFGRPVVSTRVGAEGLVFADRQEIILEDDDAGLAAACSKLLLDAAAAERVGRAAWQRARDTYDREAVKQQLQRLFLGSEGQDTPAAVRASA